MQDELVFNLPDSYAKPVRNQDGIREGTETNNWRLLHIQEERSDAFMEEIADVDALNDLSNLSGAALDAQAAMYSLTRKSGESDADFRFRLLLQMSSYFSDGTLEYTRSALALAFGEDHSFVLADSYPASVTLTVGVSLESQAEELKEIIGALLPVGVGLEFDIAHGTFLYCSTEDDFSDPDVAAYYAGTGYGDLEGTVGGTLGRWN